MLSEIYGPLFLVPLFGSKLSYFCATKVNRMRPIQFIIPIFILGIVSCKEVKPTAASENTNELQLVFYNVENLFDIEDDPNKADEEFTPTGKKMWTADRYDHKLKQLGKVISSANSHMPDILGVCEVENKRVLEDLNASSNFAKVNYSILHKESPDGRGIDVGLLYNPERIRLDDIEYIESTLPVGDRPNTRLVMHAMGEFNGEELHVYVNHWPSRYGGQKESEPNRLTVAYNVRKSMDEVIAANPAANIVMMGDFNDHPNNKSIMEVIGADLDGKKGMVNLMWEKHKRGEGSYNYRGDWGALDQFIVTPTLTDGKGLDVDENSVQFVKHDWMMYVNDEGEAYPNRTYGGPNYYAGFSDHLPIAMTLIVKE